MIRMMVGSEHANDPNVEVVTGYPGARGPLYMRTSHVGLVLELKERNGYDDSDFYAVVWNPEKGEPETVEYATTRGWTYPNEATIDATPEVVAAYHEYRERKRVEYAVKQARREAKVPRKGRLVRVARGRKVPIGTVGTVAWIGDDKYWRGWSGRNAWVLDQLAYVELGRYRVGIDTDNGRVWTNAKNVEVVEAA